MMQIAFYKGSSLDPQRAATFDEIKALTRGPYVHSCLVFTDGVTGEATDVRNAGVRFTLRGYDKGENWDMYDLPDFDEAAARLWFDEHLGAAYDYSGVERAWDPRLKENPDAWYCSEACEAALGLAGKVSKSDSNSLARQLGFLPPLL